MKVIEIFFDGNSPYPNLILENGDTKKPVFHANGSFQGWITDSERLQINRTTFKEMNWIQRLFSEKPPESVIDN